jgi:ADP-ribose pyrophosphatase YjhB (NUDIX family)
MNESPRFVVVALVFIQEKDTILLVKQSYGNQYWSLPGGVVESGESIDQAAIREFWEETSLDIRVKRPVGLYSIPATNSLAITFEGEIIGGSLAPNHEVCECQYFQLDNLPYAREHLRQRVDDFRQGFLCTFIRTQ